MDVEIVVPLGAFLMIVGIIWILSVSGTKKRAAAHETLRLMVEKGQELSPQLIKDMSLITDPRRNDLRRGVILMSLAGALAFIGIISNLQGNGDSEAFLVAIFPGMIGLAFLALWKFGYDSKAD